MNRRTYLKTLSALGILPLTQQWTFMDNPILQRTIPSTKEKLPAVGLGTWQTFDVDDTDAEINKLKEVLEILVRKGGKVIDSSPMYGRSEEVVGDLSTELKLNDSLFIATKVWTNGKENGVRQMEESFALLKRSQVDLMQIHNLTDWQTHLPTLQQWKEKGLVRYIGVTHYTSSAYPAIEQIIKSNAIDFIQINYSLLDRKAEERILPLAREKQVAVLINRPFQEGVLFNKAKGKALPEWSKEFDCNSWAQFFLKFILSNPSVTCVIPGTSKPHHMLDNIQAAYGKLPDKKQRERMLNIFM